MQKSLLVILSLFTISLVAGCGGDKFKTYSVTGKVTYKEQPVAGATVSFGPKVNDVGDAAFGRTDTNGVYRLQTRLGKPEGGTTPGEYVVTVSKVDIVPTGKSSVGSGGEVIQEKKPVSVLPDKYGNPNQSPLSFTVEKKKNTYNIVIED